MQPSNPYISTIVLLVILLIVTNSKAILTYLEWLKFKVKTLKIDIQNTQKSNFKTK